MGDKGSGSTARDGVDYLPHLSFRREFGFVVVAGVLALACLAQNAPSSTSPTKAPRHVDNRATAPALNSRADYVGDDACRTCHQDKFNTYLETAHHLTSAVATKETVLGTFAPGTNVLKTGNPDLYFQMDAKPDGFYQTAVSGIPPNTWSRTERLDLVIGSGGKGQTYLYWHDGQLFQLPVGYSTVLARWINSPGYRDGTANFERPIIPRCLECHAGYFEALAPPMGNLYNTKNFVVGVSCERCHGPGRQHVTAAKSAAGPKAITNPAKLSASRQFDVCAQCHGGPGDRFLAPPFSYVPGQALDKYIDLGSPGAAAEVDVHGRQVVVLKESRCYQVSGTMTCSTCHDVHQRERSLAAFSERCLSCHKVENCGMSPKMGHDIAGNCIDCHMPELESKAVFVDVDGKKVIPKFRTHLIKVYAPSAIGH